MFSVVLTVFVPISVLATRHGKKDAVCFDLEAWESDYAGDDDEVHEETGCKICAWQWNLETHVKTFACRDGIKNKHHWTTDSKACIYFDEGELVEDTTTYVSTDCGDGLWVDRFIVFGKGEKTAERDTEDDWINVYGKNNHNGWCVSKERNDFLDWNHDSNDQHVPEHDCFETVALQSNGNVDGWHPDETLKCRKKKKMDCKQGCDSGWKHISTSDHGCCSSFGSCGGNRKTCQKDYPCRRREGMTTEEYMRERAFNPELQGPGRWVHLSADSTEIEESELVAPESDEAQLVGSSGSDVAQRLSTALGL